MFLNLIFLSFCLSIAYIKCQDGGVNVCNQQESCAACIKYASERCVWCPAQTVTTKRCQTESFSKSNKTWCSEAVDNPQNEKDIVQDLALTPLGSKGKHKFHLTPQKIGIKIRPGSSEIFNISYQLGLDYPVDVYFLMDFSSSMSYYTQNLKTQTKAIYDTLSKVSDNVMMGMGSFVDKPALPLVDKTKHESYSYRNHIKLTSSLEQFRREIDKLTPSGANYDDPEAGLDALMQVILCEDQIGWRAEARRFVLIFTDSTYHSAGDGRIIGAFRPFDMKCHLENNEYKDKALILDYPSVGQISHIVKEKDFQIIFAIHNDVKVPYTLLAKEIGSAIVANLQNSKDIPKIIETSYKELLRYPRLNIRAHPNVQVKLDPPCSGSNSNQPECEAKDYKAKNVTVTIILSECPKDKLGPVEIGVVGLSDKLRIDIQPLCECNCEKAPAPRSSEMCSKQGTYQCGTCSCDKNWSGETCDCKMGAEEARKLNHKCIKETIRCSNRGECSCGKCVNCRGSHGDFCQYSDSDCPQPHGKVCSNHGICRYGKCECKPSWVGIDCSCTESVVDCIDPYTQKVCAGNGDCQCGKCVCGKTKDYSGEFCEDCSDCAERRCRELESFVECLYNSTMNVQKKEEEDDCWKKHHQKKDIDITFLNRTDINSEEFQTYDWCTIPKAEKSIVFRHMKISSRLDLVIQRELDIPLKANIWVAIYTTIGVILLIGLIAVIASKILVDIHDKKEYERFKAELSEIDFETNDGFNELYKPASTQVQNPRFRMSVYNN